jgi:hypothetical protein
VLGTAPAVQPTSSPCAATPTLDPQFARQNGNLDIGQPYVLGHVLVIIPACRDIRALAQKYGLGPTALVTTSSTADPLTRYYRVGVPAGEEAATVIRLVTHTEDFQYVIVDYIPIGGVPEATFIRQSTVVPAQGQPGTSFAMQVCCWDAGTAVTKIFTTPTGRRIVIADVAQANRTVAAGWGGSPDDERGTYTVFVRDDRMGLGSIVHFRVF